MPYLHLEPNCKPISKLNLYHLNQTLTCTKISISPAPTVNPILNLSLNLSTHREVRIFIYKLITINLNQKRAALLTPTTFSSLSRRISFYQKLKWHMSKETQPCSYVSSRSFTTLTTLRLCCNCCATNFSTIMPIKEVGYWFIIR